MKDRSCGCQVAEPPPALLMFACGASSRPKMSPRSLLGAESVENDASCRFVSLPARACRFALLRAIWWCACLAPQRPISPGQAGFSCTVP